MTYNPQGLIEKKFNDEKLFKLFVDSILGFDSGLLKKEEEQEEIMEFE